MFQMLLLMVALVAGFAAFSGMAMFAAFAEMAKWVCMGAAVVLAMSMFCKYWHGDSCCHSHDDGN